MTVDQAKCVRSHTADIAILSETRTNHLLLSEELKRLGIPFYVQKSQNYFQTTELRDHVGTFSFDRQSLSRYRVGCSFAFADRGAKGK